MTFPLSTPNDDRDGSAFPTDELSQEDLDLAAGGTDDESFNCGGPHDLEDLLDE